VLIRFQENYGRAKETHAHTQALWEKEIRRARKESFKSQSVVVKLQEELKAARNALRTSEADIEQEKERSKKREQEAFAARYQLVGVQEELANMIEKVKLVEQERDALRTIAKNEEIARIAAEGQIPLPPPRHDDEEFASPRKTSKSLPTVSIMSSASSEEEIEQLRMELAWERQRADRAYEHAEYVQLECQFKCCSCRLAEKKGETFHYTVVSSIPRTAVKESMEIKNENDHREALYSAPPWEPQKHSAQDTGLPQRTTIFNAAEGVFRTTSPEPEESPWISPAKPTTIPSVTPFKHPANGSSQLTPRASMHSRTPSCEPPTAAMVQEANTSLLSLIDGSHNTASDTSEDTIIHRSPSPSADPKPTHRALPTHTRTQSQPQFPIHPQAPTFHTISTTTRIPLAAPAVPAALAARTDLTPPAPSAALEDALSPTMSREEALAQIRERRGRARSLAQGMVTPKKVNVFGGRDFSAPAVRSVGRNGGRV
jgi:hypothetical protein